MMCTSCPPCPRLSRTKNIDRILIIKVIIDIMYINININTTLSRVPTRLTSGCVCDPPRTTGQNYTKRGRKWGFWAEIKEKLSRICPKLSRLSPTKIVGIDRVGVINDTIVKIIF